MGSVTVVGSLNIDRVTSVPRLPGPGETVSGSDVRTVPGGKGANQAIACSQAGAQVRLVGVCGDDEAGQTLLTALQREGVDTAHVRRLRDASTGTATILVEASGENVIAISPGANDCLNSADVEAACAVLGAGDVLLMQLEVPAPAVRRAARLAAERRATVVLNAAPATGDVAGIYSHVDVLVVNEHELGQLEFAYELTPVDTTLSGRARSLASHCDCLVVATLGAAGALMTRGEAVRHFDAPQVEVVDTVGAGDAFTGCLAAALSRGADDYSAVEQAVTVASMAVTHTGAQRNASERAEIPATPMRRSLP